MKRIEILLILYCLFDVDKIDGDIADDKDDFVMTDEEHVWRNDESSQTSDDLVDVVLGVAQALVETYQNVLRMHCLF